MTTEAEIQELVDDLKLASERVAEARKAWTDAEDQFRHWQGTMTEDILSRNRKFPEWKAKAMVRAAPGYAAQKEAVAEAREVFDLCEAEREALVVKAMLIASQHGQQPAQWPMSATAHER